MSALKGFVKLVLLVSVVAAVVTGISMYWGDILSMLCEIEDACAHGEPNWLGWGVLAIVAWVALAVLIMAEIAIHKAFS